MERLLRRLGIEDTDPTKVIQQLEHKQLEIQERLDNVADEKRREKLERDEKEIETALSTLRWMQSNAPTAQPQEPVKATGMFREQIRPQQKEQEPSQGQQNWQTQMTQPQQVQMQMPTQDLSQQQTMPTQQAQTTYTQADFDALKSAEPVQEVSQVYASPQTQTGYSAQETQQVQYQYQEPQQVQQKQEVPMQGASDYVPPQKGSIEYREAEYQIYNGDSAIGIEQMRYLASMGDPEAMNEMGLLYYKGEYLEKDDVIAMNWFLNAAKCGSMDGVEDVGFMLKEGSLPLSSIQQAMDWYMKYADKNKDAKAWVTLGVMHYDGKGIPKDYPKAFQWFLKAARAGNKDAQHNLGYMYYHGIGISKNVAEAKNWLKLSAQQGCEPAQNLLTTIENEIAAKNKADLNVAAQVAGSFFKGFFG